VARSSNGSQNAGDYASGVVAKQSVYAPFDAV
jgi:hypothetical protein